MSSLQDQLLKSGLANKKQAGRAKHHKQQQQSRQKKHKQSGIATPQQSELEIKLAQEKEQKNQQDLLLNLGRDQELEKKSIQHQIDQLIQANQIKIAKDADVSYHFTHNDKIKSIYVNEEQKDQIVSGRIVIAELKKGFVLIGHGVAKRVEEKDKIRVVILAQEVEFEEDDPYAQFVVPDDLMW